MKQIICVLILLAGIMPSAYATDEASQCMEVRQYFSVLDQQMETAFQTFLESEENALTLERALRKMSVSDLGPLVLSEMEFQALIAYSEVPGNVLVDFPGEDVPMIAAQFHGSALEFWVTVPALFRVLESDGIQAMGLYGETLIGLEERNEAGQTTIADSCPEVFSELQEQSISESETISASFDLPNIPSHQVTAFELMAITDVEIQSAATQLPLDYSGISQTAAPVVERFGQVDDALSDSSIRFQTGVTLGDPGAPVTMHIFSDFQCHFCKSFHDETLPWIIEDFVRDGQVKLVFHDFPRLGTDTSIADPEDMSVEINDSNNESAQAAHAAMCAGEQGEYLEYSDRLFGNFGGVQQGAYSRENLVRFADDLALNMDSFNTCMDSGRYLPAIAISVEQGQNHGVTAIPMFILDNSSGDVNVIQQTAEGYDLIKRQIEVSIQTAP